MVRAFRRRRRYGLRRRVRRRFARRVRRASRRVSRRAPYTGYFNVRQRVHGVTLTWDGIPATDYLKQGTHAAGPANATHFAIHFNPSTLRMWSALQDMYREFRVSTVVVYFVPQSNTIIMGADATGTGSTDAGGFLTVESSPDDYTVPASGELFATPRTRAYNVALTKTAKVVTRPVLRASIMVAGGGVASHGITPRQQWFSTDGNNINFPVVRGTISSAFTNMARQCYQVYAVAYVKFRYRRSLV